MIRIGHYFLLFLLLTGIKSQAKNYFHKPLFTTLQNEFEKVRSEADILTFYQSDSLITHTLKLVSDENGEPLFFYSFVNTPVCIDNVCKPVDIYLYWNLLGNYAGFGLKEETPLTKFDHDEFLSKDYEKLHQLLQNQHSILERKTIEDLFDPNAKPAKQVTYQGKEVDAVSGATKAEIKSSVVEGALYSCFTLWHLVHGNVEDSIAHYISENYSAELGQRFLHSNYSDYQLFALKRMEEGDLVNEIERIGEIFLESKPLIRTYIMKKLPDEIWVNEEQSMILFNSFEKMDINTRTLLIKKLSLSGIQPAFSIAKFLPQLSRNQIKLFLSQLPSDKKQIPADLMEILQKTAKSETFAYAYLIEQFLEE